MNESCTPTQHCTPQNAICSLCGYDISGVLINNDHSVTCPECGKDLRPSNPDHVMTARKIHLYFFKKLTLPTAAPAFGLLLVSWVPNLSLIFGLLHTPFMFLWCTTMWIIISTKLIKKSNPYPRPVPLWIIPFLGFLYIIPAIMLTYLYWKIGFYFMIPV